MRFNAKQMAQEKDYAFPYHYLDLQGGGYNENVWGLEYKATLAFVKDRLRPFVGQRILDAGCGDGRFCFELRDENVKLTGVDYSERAIAFARAFNPNATFHVGELSALRLQGKFDAAVMIEVLEHIPPSDIPAMMEALASLLKPRGRLVVTVPSVREKLHVKHYQHFTPSRLRDAIGPRFHVITMTGQNRVGIGRRLFAFAERLAFFIGPFERKRKPITALFRAMRSHYFRHHAYGPPARCRRLMAVCEKA